MTPADEEALRESFFPGLCRGSIKPIWLVDTTTANQDIEGLMIHSDDDMDKIQHLLDALPKVRTLTFEGIQVWKALRLTKANPRITCYNCNIMFLNQLWFLLNLPNIQSIHIEHLFAIDPLAPQDQKKIESAIANNTTLIRFSTAKVDTDTPPENMAIIEQIKHKTWANLLLRLEQERKARLAARIYVDAAISGLPSGTQIDLLLPQIVAMAGMTRIGGGGGGGVQGEPSPRNVWESKEYQDATKQAALRRDYYYHRSLVQRRQQQQEQQHPTRQEILKRRRSLLYDQQQQQPEEEEATTEPIPKRRRHHYHHQVMTFCFG